MKCLNDDIGILVNKKQETSWILWVLYHFSCFNLLSTMWADDTQEKEAGVTLRETQHRLHITMENVMISEEL